MSPEKPNVIFVFGDQWRAQATGYSGDRNLYTPNLDSLARQSINFTNAVSQCPVCSPARASMISGMYPLSHGIFQNDVYLEPKFKSIAHCFREAGYRTGYIGKWHLDGHGRSNFITPERRQGFDFWKVQECTHRYNDSYYYTGDGRESKWDGYDAIAQTREAKRFIAQNSGEQPFLLFLSWGPPHNPYHTAPEKYRSMYLPEEVELRPNVTEEMREKAARELAGYYAHVSAMDDCMGEITNNLKEQGQERDTILVFTSDHGDMLGSQGEQRKQRPWDESILVPFLLRYPRQFGYRSRIIESPISTPDIMPTLLGLSGLETPETVEGLDHSGHLINHEPSPRNASLIACYSPFGEWVKKNGGKEYRGVRTRRYTYARTLEGPWLLYDNENDPFQMNNLCHDPRYRDLKAELDGLLGQMLNERNDQFRSSEYYIEKYGLVTDEWGTVPYTE